MEKFSNLIVKEVLNDFANDFELHLSKAKGLENVNKDETLFMSERELMENSIITINNAIDGKIGGLAAVNLILSAANADVRDDVLWLELLTERSFLIKNDKGFTKTSLLYILFDIKFITQSNIELEVIKFIKNIKTFKTHFKKEILDTFKTSYLFKESYKVLETSTKKLLIDNGITRKDLLEKKRD